ncbi:hypothetical protein HC231_05550 [Brenneria izadpanahii]|uniref:Saccharopine dehydrogenase NADP binding domain-containing protein n=1 Tax=Brenneria izadpanahii TaxID=2722756 RepID=A0ABX7UTD3_9GAMM|nr:saccharopine dehydrogenase NADP-binding domain-containing protein [Brenneria izadpanahii]QTF07445.1 hypothetical protein HC231_05550 [Brenneria izadpanahii]
MKRILVIGGYGHAGAQIVDLLLAVGEAHITVAGRNLARATRFVQDREAYASRLAGMALDARDAAQLGTAALGMDLVIVAAGTSSTVVPGALAVIAAGADFLDIQVSAAKVRQLQALDAQMRALTASLPMLREGGFRVAGFNLITDFLVIPIVMAGMKLSPSLTARPLARLLRASIIHGSRPPYGAALQLDGGKRGENRTLLRISHADAYAMTAAPVVATVLQLLDGSARRPGVHLQAMLVDPPRFFADLQRFGIQVDRFFQPC